MTRGFLLGIIAMNSVWAGVFFLKFWKRTHDTLFFWFGLAFIIEGANVAALLAVPKPNEGTPWHFLLRLVTALMILIAILKKNYGRNG